MLSFNIGGRGVFVFLVEKKIVESTTIHDMITAGTMKAGLVMGITRCWCTKRAVVDAMVCLLQGDLEALISGD